MSKKLRYSMLSGLQVTTAMVTLNQVFNDLSVQSELNYSKNTQLATWPNHAMHEDDVRAVIASRRISVDGGDVTAVLDIVRQHWRRMTKPTTGDQYA